MLREVGGGGGHVVPLISPTLLKLPALEVMAQAEATRREVTGWRGEGDSGRDMGVIEGLTLDLSHIAQPADTEPVVLALQGPGNAAPHTGLTHPWGPHQAQNFAVGAPS